MVLLIIIPSLNGYNWEYTLFSDIPIWLCIPIKKFPSVRMITCPFKWLFHWGFGPHFPAEMREGSRQWSSLFSDLRKEVDDIYDVNGSGLSARWVEASPRRALSSAPLCAV